MPKLELKTDRKHRSALQILVCWYVSIAAVAGDANHAHTKLGLKSITSTPQTMSDDKTDAYVKMALSKKVRKVVLCSFCP